ncbi:hypothetical protein [Candidatus Parabeggiatoa sp. HSG14]|uniref:hypothetical protein n=1 Tax=Candidatus Parabeggiatoa sp. HSG14 TaxID=3055593 RepID=UPI0025A91B4F|nr:hypothetical protein [Thiotrichales bacterium HSG14]
MIFNQDFKEFVELLNSNKVEYLIVGGYALGIHGYPRYTGDLDIWIKPTTENAEKMVKVFDEFGFSSLGLTQTDFSESNSVIQIGYPPFRIDILTSPDGVNFEECYRNKFVFEYDGIVMHIIGFNDFKKNKEASGRSKDIEDLRNIE